MTSAPSRGIGLIRVPRLRERHAVRLNEGTVSAALLGALPHDPAQPLTANPGHNKEHEESKRGPNRALRTFDHQEQQGQQCANHLGHRVVQRF
jgi:hypothetical protein